MVVLAVSESESCLLGTAAATDAHADADECFETCFGVDVKIFVPIHGPFLKENNDGRTACVMGP